METQTETQTKVVEEQAPDRQLQYEKGVNDRFEAIEKQLALQPTKKEFSVMLAGLATKEDIALFNTYAHRFTLGVEILGTSSKWILGAVIAVGGIAAGFIFIKNFFVFALGLLGVAITRVK